MVLYCYNGGSWEIIWCYTAIMVEVGDWCYTAKMVEVGRLVSYCYNGGGWETGVILL